MCTDVFFRNADNWYVARFEIDEISFTSVEQYYLKMMELSKKY